MLDFITVASDTSIIAQPPLWWTWVGGPAIVGTVLAGIFTLTNSIVSKKTRSPENVQAQVQTLLDGLQGMINLMTEDKARDNERIVKLQERIDELENLSEGDLEYRARMYAEIQELREEVARKSLHIKLLVSELSSMGVSVTGLDAGNDQILIFDRG